MCAGGREGVFRQPTYVGTTFPPLLTHTHTHTQTQTHSDSKIYGQRLLTHTPLKYQAKDINVRNGHCLKAKLVQSLMRNRKEKRRRRKPQRVDKWEEH